MKYQVRHNLLMGKDSERTYPYVLSISTEYGATISIELSEADYREFLSYLNQMEIFPKYTFQIRAISEYERFSWQDEEKE